MAQNGPGDGDVSAPVPSAPTEGMPEGLLAPRQVLGDRYQIRSQLGRGGMGEVWRAFDLKLRVEVALKALLPDLFKDERRRDLLRREVRAAREVVSPNVCRIFDLIEVDGRELVSMEYVDGGTLLNLLADRGPLDLKEAQDIASQFLAGLEAIHQSGLVHRDVKPENIMITRAGRVVLMDFGLARQEDSGAGVVSGTPAYMAPEQARGEAVDARADVYSAGVVLAEMVSPEGVKNLESRQSVWEGIRQEPAEVPDSPWAPVIKHAVAKEPNERYNSAHTLIRELEDVTLRVEGAEEVTPYPGLASFTEADAEYFYGREAEVEAMWRTLEQPHLLAIIGPSGSGKSSFLKAGLIPARPQGWSCVVATPGSSPLVELAQALVPEFTGDAEAMHDLVRTDDPDAMASAVARWRERHDQVVLVVDQFEELFTLNPPDVQSRYAGLLGRLALENDVHVLLSMRDDFLFHCQAHEALRPVFSEITPLGPLVGGALRRALVQPGSRCGYRFEDDDLVVEMLAEVEGERGSLPLLAFAISRLWEERDRGEGLLTREAYQRIGGVGGALGRHAEATLERIGDDREPMVREIFRNLVTAQGTRAVRDLDDLLSVFDPRERDAANDVLRELVDARLLTTFETGGEGEEPRRRVEIIHESLLENWPRLVGWRTQDADSVRLRDELRQAAKTWADHGRDTDRLWTGKAFREFSVWRENYPGGLTELEEEFSRTMNAHAKRRRRRRRMARAATLTVLLVVLGIVGVSRQQAIAEANRAEASKLVTLGLMGIDADRTVALAYAIASLERADTPRGRRLALRALWAGPPATVLPDRPSPRSGPVNPNRISPWALAVAPDGRHIAAGYRDGLLQVFSRDGGAPVTVQGFEEDQGLITNLSFSPDGSLLVGGASEAAGEVRVWETEGWQLRRILRSPEPPELLVGTDDISIAYGLVEPDLSSVLTVTFRFDAGESKSGPEDFGHWVLRRWPLDGGPAQLVGEVAGSVRPGASPDPSRGLLAAGAGDELHLHHLDTLGRQPPRVVGRHSARFGYGKVAFDPTGDRLAARDSAGTLRVWPLNGDGRRPDRELETTGYPWGTSFSPDGSRLAHGSGSAGWLWDLWGPALAEPLRLGVDTTMMFNVAFTPDGRWLATTSAGFQQPYRLALWPLSDSYPRVLRGAEDAVRPGALFHPDGSRLYTTETGKDGSATLLSWPLAGGAGLEPAVLFRHESGIGGIKVDRQGRFVIVEDDVVWKVPLDGAAPTVIEGVGSSRILQLDPAGRYLVTSPYMRTDTTTLAVADLETGERLDLEVPGDGPVESFRFDRTGRLLVTRGGVLSRWDPKTSATEVLVSEGIPHATPIGDGRRLYIGWEGTGVRSILDLEDGSRTALASGHQARSYIAFDPTGSIVATGHADGEVRVGPLFSEDHHLLLGHEPGATDVWVSPDGKWVASLGSEGDLRLWPMPDFSKPPFHTLPYEELMAKLMALTNLRAVPDEESHTGYTIKPDFTAYRGWAEVPEW